MKKVVVKNTRTHEDRIRKESAPKSKTKQQQKYQHKCLSKQVHVLTTRKRHTARLTSRMLVSVLINICMGQHFVSDKRRITMVRKRDPPEVSHYFSSSRARAFLFFFLWLRCCRQFYTPKATKCMKKNSSKSVIETCRSLWMVKRKPKIIKRVLFAVSINRSNRVEPSKHNGHFTSNVLEDSSRVNIGQRDFNVVHLWEFSFHAPCFSFSDSVSSSIKS